MVFTKIFTVETALGYVKEFQPDFIGITGKKIIPYK